LRSGLEQRWAEAAVKRTCFDNTAEHRPQHSDRAGGRASQRNWLSARAPLSGAQGEPSHHPLTAGSRGLRLRGAGCLDQLAELLVTRQRPEGEVPLDFRDPQFALPALEDGPQLAERCPRQDLPAAFDKVALVKGQCPKYRQCVVVLEPASFYRHVKQQAPGGLEGCEVREVIQGEGQAPLKGNGLGQAEARGPPLVAAPVQE